MILTGLLIFLILKQSYNHLFYMRSFARRISIGQSVPHAFTTHDISAMKETYLERRSQKVLADVSSSCGHEECTTPLG